MTGHLIVSDEDARRVIKLRRPEKKNAFTQDMYRGMSDAIDKAQNNPDIRCIIITGGSGVFTAGNGWWWVPIVAPIVGAILGAFLYDVFVNKHHVAPEAGR